MEKEEQKSSYKHLRGSVGKPEYPEKKKKKKNTLVGCWSCPDSNGQNKTGSKVEVCGVKLPS